jgi:hypothetical protein
MGKGVQQQSSDRGVVTMCDVKERADFLERRYHELYREVCVVRSGLASERVDHESRQSLQRWLDATEREMREILREMDRLEDSLIEATPFAPGNG